MGAACGAGQPQAGVEDAGSVQEYVHMPMPGAGHKELVLFVTPISLPCRACLYTLKMFNLPVDICYPDLAGGQTNDPEHLKMNPIHSLPCLGVYAGDEKRDPVGINDSLAIVEYWEKRFPGRLPEWFTGGQDPLKRGKILEAVNAIKDTMYRSTVYQYVYPLAFGGILTECQYDLCKRDFILEILDKWCSEGKYLGGAKPTLADFFLVACHMTIMWNSHPDLYREWKWEEVAPKKYPKMWATIQELLKEPSIKYVHEHNPSEKCCGVQLWNDTVANACGAFPKTKPPGRGREFVYDHPQGMVHPNLVHAGVFPHGKDFDKVVA